MVCFGSYKRQDLWVAKLAAQNNTHGILTYGRKRTIVAPTPRYPFAMHCLVSDLIRKGWLLIRHANELPTCRQCVLYRPHWNSTEHQKIIRADKCTRAHTHAFCKTADTCTDCTQAKPRQPCSVAVALTAMTDPSLDSHAL